LQEYIFVVGFLSVYDGEVDPHFVFFSNDASFSLCREVSPQNSWYWRTENPTCSQTTTSWWKNWHLVFWQELQGINNMFCLGIQLEHVIYFGQEGNIFSIWSGTGEFLW